MLARIFSFVTNGVLAALVLGVAIPGNHRVAIPHAYGLSEIAPRVWTDAPGRAGELLDIANASRARVIDFFGDAAHPTLILCTTRVCAHSFGIGGNGLSIADMAVMVSPGGLTQGTLTHEMTHSRLHRSMGISNLVRQPYPTWFDEGLATHVANHPIWHGQITASDRARVRRVRNFWNWGDAYRALGVGRAYRAAATEVARIERKAGHAGLLELIARAEAGEDFDTILAEMLAR
ncbi:hypothetical protein ACFFUT_04640 [Pseudohalocynthiibacter aestuariivivens]|uniref:Peptidase MA-like domain-containing protein n=1 Tax=Pseudohalocynthiibacter aestuariivivens TaxID=1591409 RepID=A0ABV5JCA4_9RHOB|nr:MULTISPECIES: hypothetical protein [Pseudohalocynthiibacter]MBS9718982.1 hypothetical protein [Pseudohalocynthiibacter aestuariivivens]MCK0104487.1 hypothetical protein [Pseudohalocynthiibacter sp. F2068]